MDNCCRGLQLNFLIQIRLESVMIVLCHSLLKCLAYTLAHTSQLLLSIHVGVCFCLFFFFKFLYLIFNGFILIQWVDFLFLVFYRPVFVCPLNHSQSFKCRKSFAAFLSSHMLRLVFLFVSKCFEQFMQIEKFS